MTMRWSDLPVCACSLRHWPEEITARHTVTCVSSGLPTTPVWVSGDAPEDPAAARAMTEHLVALGIRLVLDVRAEAAAGTSFDLDALAAAGIEHRHVGIADHNDAFSQLHAARAWAEQIADTPDVPVLVHCHMGVNRSASAAVVLLVSRGVEPAAAMRAVLENRAVTMAPYAPPVLRAWRDEESSDAVRAVLLELRADDRRLRDVTVL